MKANTDDVVVRMDAKKNQIPMPKILIYYVMKFYIWIVVN